MAHRNDRPTWYVSSRSSGGSCVEILARPQQVLIRDSADPVGPVLSIPREAFKSFLDALKTGEFD